MRNDCFRGILDKNGIRAEISDKVWGEIFEHYQIHAIQDLLLDSIFPPEPRIVWMGAKSASDAAERKFHIGPLDNKEHMWDRLEQGEYLVGQDQSGRQVHLEAKLPATDRVVNIQDHQRRQS